MGLIIKHATAAGSAGPLHMSLPHTSCRGLPAQPGLAFSLRALRGFCVAVTGLLLTAAAQAQIIDDLEYRREGADAVLQIRFVTPVQQLRSVLARDAGQTLVFYRVLPTRQALDRATAERALRPRSLPGTEAALPAVTVTDEPVAGRLNDERRLLVRLATPAVHKVRAGRSNRAIELVFAGLGPQVPPVPAADLPPDAVGRFRVTLEASEQTGAFLSAPIPASLQGVNVFTTSRVVQGKLLHETHLGPFTRRSEAEVALAAVRKRFPKAEVTTDDAPTAPAATAVAGATPPAPSALGASAPVAGSAVKPVTEAAASAASAPAAGDLDTRASALMATAVQALARNEPNAAIDALSQVLDLPPTVYSRRAQALIGQARMAAGDAGRARAEYEFFLRLYPVGPDADQVRAAVAALSGPAAGTPGSPGSGTVTAGAAGTAQGGRAATTTLTGSISASITVASPRCARRSSRIHRSAACPNCVSDATYVRHRPEPARHQCRRELAPARRRFRAAFCLPRRVLQGLQAARQIAQQAVLAVLRPPLLRPGHQRAPGPPDAAGRRRAGPL
jgi:hypothetical protein